MKAWKMVLALALALLFCAPGMAQDEKKKRQQATPEETFKKMDADNDGKVTKEEWKKYVDSDARMQKAVEKDAEFASKMFDRMDSDKDGKVTLDEYKKFREAQGRNRKKKDPN
ncbi:MAG: EF-hand domain-containing protein [Planctomycetia bacterium]|nr:EF-hand domain-containing protein [Planctomycetia bacterium]